MLTSYPFEETSRRFQDAGRGPGPAAHPMMLVSGLLVGRIVVVVKRVMLGRVVSGVPSWPFIMGGNKLMLDEVWVCKCSPKTLSRSVVNAPAVQQCEHLRRPVCIGTSGKGIRRHGKAEPFVIRSPFGNFKLGEYLGRRFVYFRRKALGTVKAQQGSAKQSLVL